MKANKGFQAEQSFAEFVKSSKMISLKKLDNSVKSFEVQDRVIVAGSGNSEKWDIVVNSGCRLQVKSTTGMAATIVNMVPLRNMEKLAKHSLLDVQPLMEALTVVSNSPASKVKLSELFDKEDWRDIITHFVFEGSATKTAKPFEQATALVEIGKDGYLLVEKHEAVDYLWEKLTAEIRYRKSSKSPAEPFLHIRMSK